MRTCWCPPSWIRGKDISKDAQDRAPQGSTGRARRGIRWLLRRGDKPGDKSVDIGWTSDVVHGSLLETGTSQQEAQPHLRPAVDEGHASGRIDNRFIEGVNSAIARILGRS